MDYNRVKTWLAIIGVISLIALSFFMGRKSVQPTITTEIKWDTLRVEVPVPYKVEKVRTEYVYVHTPADTVVIERIDSVLVAVDIEQRIYQDDRYRAVVSGAVVGDIHPELESMDIYTKTETVVVKTPTPFIRPYISASVGDGILGIGGGVSIKRRFDIGARYMRIDNKDKLAIEASYRF